MPPINTQKTGLREEFDKQFPEENAGCDGCHISRNYQNEQRDWWLAKFTTLQKELIEEIINELESNPNPDGSQSPNIQHWIERKQSQLRNKLK
jgi:hypothetical protein